MCERRFGQHVVGEAVRQLCQRVRRQRRDHEQVGARQVDVQILRRRTPREREERFAADEAVGAVGHDGNDLVFPFDEEADELAGLVGGDAARHADEDPRHALILPCNG
jgi:hypothetical protein